MKTVFVLRHADFDLPPGGGPAPDSSPLNAAGQERAKALARLLGRAGVTAVFASQAARTQQTAQPLADHLTLPVRVVPAQNAAALLGQILDPTSGPVVVVVGHSTTVPALLTGLGVSGPPPQVEGHIDLFVVSVATAGPPPEASVVRLTYGAVPAPAAAAPAGITTLGALAFSGNVIKSDDLSAVDVLGDGRFAVLGSDETNLVQVLERDAAGGYTVLPTAVVLNPGEKELDIEGIAHDGHAVYVVGSHSAKRKKVEPHGQEDADRKHDKNRDRLEVVEPAPERDCLYRFTLDANGNASAPEASTLRPFLKDTSLFERFLAVPGKENGIDIEGLAFHDGKLYVGFRGPVLREGWAPVLRCKFVTPEVKKDDGELLFVNLGGYGVRDLARGKDEFLILAGPAGEARSTFRLYSWDGEDCLPGKRTSGRQGKVTPLGDVPAVSKGKPEGITLLGEDATGYELLVVYDTVVGGNPTRLRVPKG
jgi:phosphohistidine phosphatase SixA